MDIHPVLALLLGSILAPTDFLALALIALSYAAATAIVLHGLTSQPLMTWYDREQKRR